MKKTIIVIVILAIIGVLIYMFTRGEETSNLTQNETPDETADINNGDTVKEEKQVSGTVISINTDQVAFDGPELVVIRDESDREYTLALPSMGRNLCVSKNVLDAAALKNGDKVEVLGEVTSENQIVPCTSSSHYLRVVAE